MRAFVGLLLLSASAWNGAAQNPPPITYHNEYNPDLRTFSPGEIVILEKLNRADGDHLDRLQVLLVPDVWVADELEYSPLPRFLESVSHFDKYIVVHLPSQVFGGYEYGHLVRWGPVSSGRAEHPTPEGLFHLNWRARSRTSTENPKWRLGWYFNFQNFRGLAFHEFALPGRPASHACLRLLERDAMWMFNWGAGWVLNDDESKILSSGTPVLIVGAYDFTAPRPWMNPSWWHQPPALPDGNPTVGNESAGSGNRVD